MKITVQEIANEMKANGLALEVVGDADRLVTGLSPVENAAPGDLVFMDKKDYLATLFVKKPAVVVTSKPLAALFAADPNHAASDSPTVLIAANVALAHALIKSKYASRDHAKSGWNETKVHPSSVVHETAKLADGVIIEPRAVIGKNVTIARGCRVMAGVVIENDVTIDENTVLHPSCVIGYGSRIGRDVVVGSGSVIGSEGYGFAQDSSRKSFPIPQTGVVVLEDRVRVGANCCIDRATYRETRIGAGTKLDNLCHIAHNVEIGQDCLLTSMFCVAGSTKIGNRVIASGQTGVIDHVSICDDAVLLHRAGVTKDIEKPGAYAGLPTQPLSDYLKNSAVLRNAVDLRKRVGDLEEKSNPAAAPL